MSQVCVDACLAVKMVLTQERLRRQARQIFLDAALSGGEIIAPTVFVSEVDSIVRRREHIGELTAEEALSGFQQLDELRIVILDPFGIRKRAREIAREFNQERVYDSTYAALAEILGCEFWTAERAFYLAVRDRLTFVKYLADYPLP